MPVSLTKLYAVIFIICKMYDISTGAILSIMLIIRFFFFFFNISQAKALQSQQTFSCFPCTSLLSHFLSPPPAVRESSKFTLGRQLLVCSALKLPRLRQTQANTLGKYTHVPLHTCSQQKKNEAEWEPFCAFLDSTVHCCNILLMTSHSQQQSVTFLRFANLHRFPFPAWFCVSVPTSWMSVSPFSIQISCWYSVPCVLLDISNIWFYPWYFTLEFHVALFIPHDRSCQT